MVLVDGLNMTPAGCPFTGSQEIFAAVAPPPKVYTISVKESPSQRNWLSVPIFSGSSKLISSSGFTVIVPVSDLVRQLPFVIISYA